MKADVWWVVGGALVVFLTVVGVLVDRYLCAVYWWPLVGTEWRAELAWNREHLRDLPGFQYDPGGSAPHEWRHIEAGELFTQEMGDDDAWVERLHVINLDAHRDRPIAQLTHYEVEAVIRDLGVPEWVPQRYRTAA